ncbi:phenylalanine--tRNA ligase beta subunit-related protein [uncultured Mailhella sp.]|uniref:B3/B4 domain-containing protein n=1 Tax=uncultured Mailhella sp. TaxID=1981031 RepID=UPI0025EC2BE1|nr:phenylalanine--tRNA ligase beta subunit-related protein [uncultured Mailhella sp.]
MKHFVVDEKVFDALPGYCLGVVAARGLDNARENGTIARMLEKSAAEFAGEFRDVNVRELPSVAAYRAAFTKLGMNPNKFMCSIEALTKRVQKSGHLPHINPVVDLGNAFSLRYQLPMGAHDVDRLEDCGMAIRFSTAQDHFLGMGEEKAEAMPEDELVYVSGRTVKTRRWIWRQSDDGKITEATSHVFFPIDGFEDVNGKAVLAARDELAGFLRQEFHCEVWTGWINDKNPVFDFSWT